MEFLDASPNAWQEAAKKKVYKKYNYPFGDIPIGKAIAIEPEEIKLTILRTLVNRFKAKHGINLVVKNHGHVYEVARLPNNPINVGNEDKSNDS